MKKSGGFTLMEVLVSMVVLSALAIGVLGTMAFGRGQVESVSHQMIAETALEKKMAELRKKSAKEYATGTFSQDVSDAGLWNGVLQWVVEEPDTTNHDWKKITLTVSWDPGTEEGKIYSDGQPRKVSRKTVLFLSGSSSS